MSDQLVEERQPKTVSIIVPTIGRATLKQTLASFAAELIEGDHVHVAFDGEFASDATFVKGIVREHERYSLAEWHYWNTGELGHWGHAARNHVLDHANIDTDFVWTIDDDDVMVKGSLGIIRNQREEWTVYRMQFGPGHPARGVICWRQKDLRLGDIGTPMHVAKPCNARFGLRYEGDWDYALALKEELLGPVWSGHIIALIRPDDA